MCALLLLHFTVLGASAHFVALCSILLYFFNNALLTMNTSHTLHSLLLYNQDTYLMLSPIKLREKALLFRTLFSQKK